MVQCGARRPRHLVQGQLKKKTTRNSGNGGEPCTQDNLRHLCIANMILRNKYPNKYPIKGYNAIAVLLCAKIVILRLRNGIFSGPNYQKIYTGYFVICAPSCDCLPSLRHLGHACSIALAVGGIYVNQRRITQQHVRLLPLCIMRMFPMRSASERAVGTPMLLINSKCVFDLFIYH